MATLQLYLDDNNARLFDGDLTVTISTKIRKLKQDDVKGILKRFGYSMAGKWKKTDWGWEGKYYRRNK